MFPRISESKFKEGVLVGPQIRELIQDVKLEDQLSEVEKAAWKSFKNVTTNVFKNRKAEDEPDMVAHLVQSYTTMGCNMSSKVRFLHSHLRLHPRKSRGAVGGKYGVRFQHGISNSVRRQVESQYGVDDYWASMVWMITGNI